MQSHCTIRAPLLLARVIQSLPKPLQLWPSFPIPPPISFPCVCRCAASCSTSPLPDPVLQAGTDGDDIWLHQRVRHSHDVWHVICGCPTTVAGEVAMNGVNVMQLRWPGSAMLLGADLLHHCLEGPVPGEVQTGEAVAYGLELGQTCAPLLAQRWEEGWRLPLAQWRQQLGIAALVERSPFAASGALDHATAA